MRVLVLDDSALFRDLIRRSVEAGGHGRMVGGAHRAEDATRLDKDELEQLVARLGEHRFEP